jgi:hypothetical protein
MGNPKTVFSRVKENGGESFWMRRRRFCFEEN